MRSRREEQFTKPAVAFVRGHRPLCAPSAAVEHGEDRWQRDDWLEWTAREPVKSRRRSPGDPIAGCREDAEVGDVMSAADYRLGSAPWRRNFERVELDGSDRLMIIQRRFKDLGTCGFQKFRESWAQQRAELICGNNYRVSQ